MNVPLILPAQETLDDARDILSVAATLGMEVPAPAGTTVWRVKARLGNGNWEDLGLHSTEESAQVALCQGILRIWNRTGRSPWHNIFYSLPKQRNTNKLREIEKTWIQTHSQLELIEEANAGEPITDEGPGRE